jgi:PucR C-terminal helix-turn-helix domain
MTKMTAAEPWRSLPPEVADVIEPELGAVTTEILATIAREVPEYARPFEGSFGRGVQVGVTEALRQFVALIRDPDSGREPGRDVYIGLGRGELRQGRTLDALQSAYRVGARVAWRRLAEAARRAGLDSGVISTLAESIFAYIEELSADSVEGYSQELSEREGERQRRRRELIALLLRDPPPAQLELGAAAETAGWDPPRTAAALACREADLGRLARRLPPDVLAAVMRGVGCVVIGDPDGPGRARQVEEAAGRITAALGPSGELAELAGSWTLARTALRALEAGAIDAAGPLRAEERLPELLLHENPELVERLAARRLAPFGPLTPKARRRTEETALAYVQRQGNAAAMAAALDIHPQTARYRVARLRELLGTDLDDPDARLELELALRARAGTD